VMDRWLDQLAVRVNDTPVTQAALDAYLRFGKGRHPARLNLGDCFAYALAKALDAPLLYKGDDFALTDVRSAL
jgi:ribonuclease VapC